MKTQVRETMEEYSRIFVRETIELFKNLLELCGSIAEETVCLPHKMGYYIRVIFLGRLEPVGSSGEVM
jgi:hypothetical protein